MKKIVIAIGDPHAKVSNTKEIAMLGDRIIETAEKLREKNPEAQIEIVVLGDLANDFEKIHIIAMRSIVQFLKKLTSFQVPVYYIVGNHDCINNQVFLEDYHAFVGLKDMPYLRIVDTPVSSSGFIFCPYVPPGRFLEALDVFMTPETEEDRQLSIPSLAKHSAIFCHQEFKGAKMGAIESVHGDEWPDNFPLVVSGHIHDRQWLQKNILYVGEPMDSAYGSSQARTISILLFEDGNFIGEKAHDLGLPRKITVDLTVEEANAYQVPENSSVRVNLKGTTEEIAAFKKTKKYTELAKVAKVVPKHTDKVVVKANKERVGYLDLLKKACEAETDAVKRAFVKLTQSEGVNAP